MLQPRSPPKLSPAATDFLGTKASRSKTCRSRRIPCIDLSPNIRDIQVALSSDVGSCPYHCSPHISRCLRIAHTLRNYVASFLYSSTDIFLGQF
jgi:hypothetical protein